jgi:subtilisin family serine protease
MHRSKTIGVLCCALWVSCLVLPSSAKGGNGYEVIIGLRSEGPFRIEGCAEHLTRRHRPLAGAFADASDSLDRVNARYDLSTYRAVFRGGLEHGDPESARRRFAERLRSRVPRRGGAARSRGPTRTAANALFDVYRVSIPSEHDPGAAMQDLAADPHVAFVQPDFAVDVDVAFDDPFLSSVGSWGQPYEDLWGLHAIRAPEAWDLSLGEGVVVAVVDTGLDFEHPEIRDQYWINPGEDLDGDGRYSDADLNGVDDDGNGFVDDVRGYDFAGYGRALAEGAEGAERAGDADPSDDNGHGTHVAGTIAAAAGNAFGIAGVAPGARVMAVKAFSSDGVARSSDAWRGVVYAAENGAQVVNASFSCARPCPENPLARVVLEVLESLDVVFVTSAGNAASDVIQWVPENQPTALTVGGHGFDDRRSSSSNFGWLLDLVAPGGGPETPFSVLVARRNILSLRAAASDDASLPFAVEEIFDRRSGTSMAAPHVAGAAALLLAQRPHLSASEIRRILRVSARSLDAIGHGPEFGAGALDVAAALTTELPRLRLRLSEPSPGTVLTEVDRSPVEIRGVASGDELEALEVAIATGVRGRDFTPVVSWLATDAVGGASSLGDEERPLGYWDAGDVPDGAYVIRLRATSTSGSIVDEYSIVGIERTRPLRLSAAVASRRPAVSGGTVVWEQSLEGSASSADEDPVEMSGVGLVRFPRAGDAPRPGLLVSRVGSVQQPRIDDAWVAWLASAPDGEEASISGCRVRPWKQGGGTCVRSFESPIPAMPLIMRFARRTAAWSAGTGGGFDLSACRAGRGSRCAPIELWEAAPSTSSRILSSFDGSTLLWKSSGTGSRLEFCSIRLPGAEVCDPMPVLVGGREIAVEEAAISGDLVALAIRSGGENLLGACRIDLMSGVCEAQVLGAMAVGRAPVVSGRRIAWIEPRPNAFDSLVFCELDPFSGACPIQRVTGAPAPLLHPDLDGRFLVWEDGRFDVPSVMGVELPELHLAGDVSISHRRRATVVAWASGFEPSPERLRLELVGPVEGTPIPFEFSRRSGRGFTMRFQLPASLPATLVIVATTESGLETRSSFEIERPPRASTGRPESGFLDPLRRGWAH